MEPAFHCERECTCSLSIYPNKGTAIADFSVLGDKAPGIAWTTCPLHTAAPELLKALESWTQCDFCSRCRAFAKRRHAAIKAVKGD